MAQTRPVRGKVRWTSPARSSASLVRSDAIRTRDSAASLPADLRFPPSEAETVADYPSSAAKQSPPFRCRRLFFDAKAAAEAGLLSYAEACGGVAPRHAR